MAAVGDDAMGAKFATAAIRPLANFTSLEQQYRSMRLQEGREHNRPDGVASVLSARCPSSPSRVVTHMVSPSVRVRDLIAMRDNVHSGTAMQSCGLGLCVL
jgi:hypothetical protein